MCKCGYPEAAHSYGLCPGGGGIAIPPGHDWAIVDEGGELVCRAQSGGGLAQVFGRPNYVQEYAAWCRYLRAHNYRVRKVHPRGFFNEFDLVVGSSCGGDHIRSAARLLTRPSGDYQWYGRVRLEEPAHATTLTE